MIKIPGAGADHRPHRGQRSAMSSRRPSENSHHVACGFCTNCVGGFTGFCRTVNPGFAGGAYGYVAMGPWPGGQAEYLRAPYADFNCLKLPPGNEHETDFVLLADIFPTDYHGCELAGVRPGESVVVYGGGPVGLMAAHSALLRGAKKVFVVDRVSERLEKAREIGAIPVNFAEGDPVDRRRDSRPGAAATGYPKLARMDWLPLLSTLAGAAIGIVATLIADRNRWKREDAKEALRLRLDIYTQYTTTVKVLGEALRALADREHPSNDERALALRDAFRDSGIGIASERMWLIAPQSVVKASNSVFHCLRRICDGYIDGTAVRSPEDRARWEARGRAAAEMRKLMREDLGVGPLTERHSPLLDDWNNPAAQ